MPLIRMCFMQPTKMTVRNKTQTQVHMRATHISPTLQGLSDEGMPKSLPSTFDCLSTVAFHVT